jgi:hypothetical protein
MSFRFRFVSPKPGIREKTVPASVTQALNLLRQRVLDYECLRAAVRAVLSEDEGAMRVFCEDFGMDQVDPVTKLDVLRYALKLTRDANG